MAFLKAFIPMLLTVIITLFTYSILKAYVLDKIKISKWVVLGLGLIVMFVPAAIYPKMLQNVFLRYFQTYLFLVLFLWFLDLMGWSGRARVNKKENDKNEVIRSKAKPNRVKKDNMEVIKNNTTKKKKKK